MDVIFLFSFLWLFIVAGIPQCYWYGEFDEFNCIVLDLLGPSLKDIRQTMTPMPFDIIIELICQMVRNNLLFHIYIYICKHIYMWIFKKK